jgi:hypothetical protein
MKPVVIISLVFSLAFCLTIAGCVGDSKNNAVSPTPIMDQSSLMTPTIDEKLWVPVVDNTYVLTATGIASTIGLSRKDIPVTPNTIYRLNVNGEKKLNLAFYSKEEKGTYNKQGYIITAPRIYDTTRFAPMVTSYNGIIKPNSVQNNLRIEWALFAQDKDQFGTSQNVKVKLERYSGNASMFPETTNDPSY